MKVMVLVKADEKSEAGVMPRPEEFEAMLKFNTELANAGVILGGDGLHPTSKGKRVKFAGGKTTVIDGPFTESKELVAGYGLWQVSSMEEAVEWVKKAPFQDAEVEIRRVFAPEDFAGAAPEPVREGARKLREQIAKKK
jgi:hypothetical protein